MIKDKLEDRYKEKKDLLNQEVICMIKYHQLLKEIFFLEEYLKCR